jgi:uncharacterized repeat protein (TIGR03943 family)
MNTESRLQIWLKGLVLLALATYFAFNIWTGNLANYINERFVWLSYLAVGLFVLLGIFTLLTLRSTEKAKRLNTDHAITWPILAMSAVPLVVGVLIPSVPLGANAVNGNISTRAVLNSNDSASSFSIPPERRNVLDWLRAFSAADDLTAFDHQPVDVVGFVYRETDFDEDHFMVARFTVSCCVADASALGLPVYAADSDTLEAGQWVRVQGTLIAGEFREDVLPIVQASQLEVVQQPEHPYLYP